MRVQTKPARTLKRFSYLTDGMPFAHDEKWYLKIETCKCPITMHDKNAVDNYGKLFFFFYDTMIIPLCGMWVEDDSLREID